MNLPEPITRKEIYLKAIAENGGGGGGGGSASDYSLTETATGEKWIDGKAVYRRVFDMNHMSAPASNQWSDLNIDTSDMDTLIDAVFLGDDAQGRFDNTVFSGWGATNNNVTNTLWILPTVMTGVLNYVILTYTKK